ncbi:MAG: hypothetical protein WAX69_20890 [Victivallales bacterium]
MKKLGLAIVLSFFLAGMTSAADAPVNPFDKYDRDIKKIEDKQSKEKDSKKLDAMRADIKKIEAKKDKELKKLTTPMETEREKLIADIDKAKEKNADVTVKQARLDYLDKLIQYYNDLSSGKTAEMPKDPAKTPPPAPAPANKDAPKDDAKTDTPAVDPMAVPAEKAKEAPAGDQAK